jgi:hypothetical protein
MGVILYILIAGKRPFIGSTIAILYQKILHLDYEIPPYFSSGTMFLFLTIRPGGSARENLCQGSKETYRYGGNSPASLGKH